MTKPEYGEPLTDLERANLAREFTIIGGGIQEGIAYIRMRDTQGNVHAHPRPYWREQAARIEAQIQEGLKLRAAVEKIQQKVQLEGASARLWADYMVALASDRYVADVDFDLSAALIALAGENKE